LSPPIPRNKPQAADHIDRRSGLLAFAATLVLQSWLILWAGYFDIDRTAPEGPPIRTTIRFAVAAAGPQPEAEPPPLTATPAESLPPPIEPVADPVPEAPEVAEFVKPIERLLSMPVPAENVSKPVVEEAVPELVEPKTVVETPKEIVPQKPVEAKPAPPPVPKPESVRQETPEVADAAPAMDTVVPQTAPSAEPAAKELVAGPADREPASVSSPDSSTAASEAKTADALLAALASMIERYKKYPRAAQRARLEGDVRVKVLVDSGGRLRSYNLIESSGHGILDKATLAIFKQINGKRIASNEMERALEIVVPVCYVRQ
jgi:protein TonB